MAAARRSISSGTSSLWVDTCHGAEGVLDGARAVTVELVLHGPNQLGTRGQRGLDGCVHVLDVDHHAHRGATEGPRSARTHLGVFVGQHDHRVADDDLGVTYLTSRARHPHLLGGAKDPLVEVQRLGRSVNDQIRSRTVITIWNRLHLGAAHVCLLARRPSKTPRDCLSLW